MDVPVLVNQQEITNNSSAQTEDGLEDLLEVMDNRGGWREKESGKSVLAAQLDNDDDELALCEI